MIPGATPPIPPSWQQHLPRLSASAVSQAEKEKKQAKKKKKDTESNGSDRHDPPGGGVTELLRSGASLVSSSSFSFFSVKKKSRRVTFLIESQDLVHSLTSSHPPSLAFLPYFVLAPLPALREHNTSSYPPRWDWHAGSGGPGNSY